MARPDRERLIREIAEDRQHGAAELACRCLEIIAAYAAQSRDLEATRSLADELRRARPGMSAIRTVLRAWERTIAPFPSEREAVSRASGSARELLRHARQAAHQVAQNGANLLRDAQTILTHSYSSSIVDVLRRLRTHPPHVIVTESRPLLEGHTLLRSIVPWGYPATLITEAQAGIFIPRCDAVVVGADALFADGAVLNKCGTRLLALAAREDRVPFYVCCASFKFNAPPFRPEQLEVLDPRDLGAPELSGLEIRNYTFDLTAGHLITAYVTECGVYRELAALQSASAWMQD